MKTRSTLCGLVSMALLSSVLILVLLVEGCSTTPASPSASQTSTTATKPYGSLVIPTTFSKGIDIDPHLAGDAFSFNSVGAAVFDSLVELTPEGRPRAGIAERWEISKDGLTHSFYIRKGVKFHDGSDLTGADVKFSAERVLDPKSTGTYITAWRQAIASVELKDDYTVVYRMKSPQFDLLPGFENLGGVAAVVPKKYIEEKGKDYFAKRPVGSGPWKVLSSEYGSRVDLEANENFSDSARVPKFKNITLISVDEEATRVAMLKTGELDVASVAADSVPALKSAGIRLTSFRGGTQHMAWLFYDLDHPELYHLGDVRVRKALSLAINRQEMASKLLSGYGEPMAVFMVPPSASFFDPNVVKPDPYDPEQAKKLLVEAGYPNGFNLKLWTAVTLNEKDLNSAVAGYWNKIGVKVEMAVVDLAKKISLWTPKMAPEAYDTAIGHLTGSNGFQFEKMISYHSKKSSQKNIRNLKLDELIDKVAQMPPSDEKKKLQLEAVVMAKNEYAIIPFLMVDTILALGPKVGGITPVAGISLPAYGFATITHPQ